LEVDLHEALAGAAVPADRPLGARPLALELRLLGRGLVEVALGGPFAVSGTFTRGPATDAAATPELLPAHGVVWGTARLLMPRGIFYDLRLASRADADPREVVTLEGARRFVRGDLYASATMLEGELRRGDQVLAVRLRFDARDDLASLLRSVRLGPRLRARTALLGGRRGSS